MPIDQRVKELAYVLDPEAFVSYSGRSLEHKQMTDARRESAFHRAHDIWAHEPDRASAMITCMCGEEMYRHSPWDGHLPVSMWDHRQADAPYHPPLVNLGDNLMLNMSKAVLLLNDATRAIGVCYDAKDPEDAKARHLTVYAFKSLDHSLKVGDHVAVFSGSTKSGLAIGLVMELDVPVDYDSNDFQMRWIAASIDLSPLKRIEEMEAEAIKTIKDAENTRRRAELRKAMLEQVNPDTLRITHEGGTPPTTSYTPPEPRPRQTPPVQPRNPDDDIPF